MPSPEPDRFWSWRVEPNELPLGMALTVGLALRAAVLKAASELGFDRLSNSLHDSGPEGGHRHAYWLSEDRDCDGAIDHVTLSVESGIDGRDILALQATSGFCLNQTRFHLYPVEAGVRRKGGLFGPGTIWIATTPFVTRLWRLTKTGKLRPDFTPSKQLIREIRELEDRDRNRRLTEPVCVGWLSAIAVGNRSASAGDFIIAADGIRPNADAIAAFPVVTFAEAVIGPIAVGFGAHFGLGLLVPTDAEPKVSD